MTRREYSDSTLDAIAAARPTLAERIDQLRQDYRTEAGFAHLTTHTPPVTRRVVEAGGHYEVETEPTYNVGVGMPLSGRMMTLIGDLPNGYNRRHQPVRDFLTQWERKCRRLHARWPDHRGRPVCAEIAWNVIYGETSIEWAAEQVEVSFPRAERLLELAVDYIEAGISRSAEPIESQHDRDRCPICRAA